MLVTGPYGNVCRAATTALKTGASLNHDDICVLVYVSRGAAKTRSVTNEDFLTDHLRSWLTKNRWAFCKCRRMDTSPFPPSPPGPRTHARTFERFLTCFCSTFCVCAAIAAQNVISTFMMGLCQKRPWTAQPGISNMQSPSSALMERRSTTCSSPPGTVSHLFQALVGRQSFETRSSCLTFFFFLCNLTSGTPLILFPVVPHVDFYYEHLAASLGLEPVVHISSMVSTQQGNFTATHASLDEVTLTLNRVVGRQ